ncbi:hypothetical protein TrVE_jg160 [Triparma verrucosa]|uniref:Uncharacterized protein n=1 Tax=Triparma verrucosa TaxID=1606542 RepID=A0A9W7F8C7_9STRA|nr:hypothetical protein TrVE_jg160 [Triparma verrucosa]
MSSLLLKSHDDSTLQSVPEDSVVKDNTVVKSCFLPRDVQEEIISRSRSKKSPIIIHWSSLFFCVLRTTCPECIENSGRCCKIVEGKWREVIRRRKSGIVRHINSEVWLVFEFDVGEGGGFKNIIKNADDGDKMKRSMSSSSLSRSPSPPPPDIRKRRRTFPLSSSSPPKSRQRRKANHSNSTVIEIARKVREEIGMEKGKIGNKRFSI